MSIKTCLAAAVKSGKLSDQGMEEYSKLMVGAEKAAHQAGRGGINAFIFATSEAAKNMVTNGERAKVATARTIMAIDKVWEDSGNHSYGRLMGLLATMGENIGGKYAPNSFPAMRESALNIMESFMDQLLPKMRTDWAGLKTNSATAMNVALELRGRSTGDPIAKAGAEQYGKATDWGVKMLKQMGVAIKNVEEWRSPQRFDPLAVRSMGIMRFSNQMDAAWRRGDLILQDWETGDLAKLVPGEDDLQARTIFNKAYENIVNDGATTMEPGHAETNTLAGKYGQRRVFQWASADAWAAANRAMGVGDEGVADLLMSHVSDLARDVAMAQILGPQPERAWPIVLQMYRNEGGSRIGEKLLDSLYYHASGQSAHPVNERLALASQSARSALASAQLFKMVLSQASDFAFARSTASWNDLPITQFGLEMIKGLDPTNKEHRSESLRMGLGIMEGLRGLHDLTRESLNDVYNRRGNGTTLDSNLSMMARMTGKTTEFVMRVQAAAKATELVRGSIGRDFLTTHGSWAGLKFDELPKGGRNFMENYGISSQEWDVLRGSALSGAKDGQVPFIYAARMAREGSATQRDLAMRYLGGITAEQKLGAIEGNLVIRAAMLGKTNPGEIAGEALRFGFQYKSFPVGALIMHGFRMFDSLWMNNGSQMFRGSYIAGLGITATAMGMIAVQLDHIVSGRDPEPMDTPTFLGKALAKGGFGGIAVDWVKQALTSGNAKDIVAAGAGPMAGLTADIMSYAGRNAYNSFAQGKQSHWGLEGAGLLARYHPDTIYTKLAIDRLVFDNLKRMADPAAVRAFANAQMRAIQQMGTRYWYPPGHNLPDRPPDPTRIYE